QPEAARERNLRLVADVLAAKHQDRMLLERRAHILIGGVARRHVIERHAAQLGGETGTQRDDIHGVLPKPNASCQFPSKQTGRQACSRMRSPHVASLMGATAGLSFAPGASRATIWQ